MKYKELYREKHIRDDGWLSELISMKYDDTPFDCVHSYLVSINPGKTRANHYHKCKKEWIAIVMGKIMLFMEDVNTLEKEKIILDVTTEDYKLIYLPPHIAHAVKNIGDCVASIVVFSTMPEVSGDTISHKFEDT